MSTAQGIKDAAVSNLKRGGLERKTDAFLDKRLHEVEETLWQIFTKGHDELTIDADNLYYRAKIYEDTKQRYEEIRDAISEIKAKRIEPNLNKVNKIVEKTSSQNGSKNDISELDSLDQSDIKDDLDRQMTIMQALTFKINSNPDHKRPESTCGRIIGKLQSRWQKIGIYTGPIK